MQPVYHAERAARRQLLTPEYYSIPEPENTTAFIAVLIIQSIKYSPVKQCANETRKIAEQPRIYSAMRNELTMFMRNSS